MENVIDYIRKININEPVVLACSYGPDSMCLLDILYNMGISIVVAHVNHQVRKESNEEFKLLKEYCLEKNIPFEGIVLTGYEKGNFENYAREFRYDFFEKVMQKYKSKILLTAHHGDDLIETILMRIVRGSSLKGYKGFDIESNMGFYKIIRPLIFVTKDDIQKYNELNNVPYAIDYTNNQDDYTRNRFRHYLLPFLKKENEKVHTKFIEFSNDINRANEFIESIISKKIDYIYNNNKIDLKKLRDEEDYVKEKIILRILNIWYKDDLKNVTHNRCNEIIKMMESDKPNISLTFPNGLHIIKAYDKLEFTKSTSETCDYQFELSEKNITPLGKISILDNSKLNSNFILRLNTNDIKLPILIRNYKNGDKIKVKNMKEYKKVKDIFINEKIERQERNIYPIVTDATGEIIWIPGLKKSNFDIPINGEYDIILWYEKGRNYDE